MREEAGIFIKRADDSDIQPAAEFAFKMVREVYDRGVNPVWDADLLNFKEYYLCARGNSFLIALNGDGEIAGTLAVRRYDGRISVLEGYYDLGVTAELARCCVDKKYRRKGIGSLLVREAEKFCAEAGYRVIYLHTHMHLPGAYEFWCSQGFRLRIYEGSSMQTAHMEKILPS